MNNDNYKLKKGRGFESSNERVLVKFAGTFHDVEIAFLLKSAIINQTIILVGYEGVWHEINALDLGLDNSDLNAFKDYVETHALSLADVGVETEKKQQDYTLTYTDHMELSKKFPDYDYIQIGKLETYLKSQGGPGGIYSLTEELKRYTRDGITIDEGIRQSEQMKKNIIDGRHPLDNGNNNNLKEENMNQTIIKRTQELIACGLIADAAGNYTGHGFTVTSNSIENDADTDWAKLIVNIIGTGGNVVAQHIADMVNDQATVETTTHVAEVIGDGSAEPQTEAKPEAAATTTPAPTASEPAKKPVSMTVISNLKPERITELKDLQETQNQIVKANPFIKITDKATRDAAAKSVQILLKASTAIDGKTGILAQFVTQTNNFIKMGKDYLNPLAKITRDAHDLQKKELEAWDNAEAIRKTKEKKAKTQKIVDRTNILFAIPMVFNGELYSIGTLHILPSKIESATDAEFDALVAQATALAKIESDKDEALKKMAAILAANGLNPDGTPITATPVAAAATPVAETTAAPVTQTPATPAAVATPTVETTPAAQTVAEPAAATTATTGVVRFAPSPVYTMPSPDNKIVNNFDMQHLGLISENPINPNFIKCRAYFIEGTKQVAAEIEAILNDPDVTVKKSVRIANLVAVLKSTV